MSAEAAADDRLLRDTVTRAATVVSYAGLAIALVASRTVGLDQSLWTDEIVALESFIREGPREILAGPDLSHELFGLLAWASIELVGESEVVLRVWSVVPFLAGVALVTTWLHRTAGALAGVLFLFLATVSPLLLDVTRQARGYGLAFLAMGLVVVAGLEVIKNGRTAALVAFCAGGIVGTATLPQFGIAFVAAGVVLLAVAPDERRRLIVALVASLLATAAFYAPHLAQVRDAAQIEDGVRIDTLWLVTAPVDQVLLPALIWIDGTALVAGPLWLPAVLLAVIVMAASSLARDRRTVLLLASGPVVTVIALWAAQAYVIPRYLSFLLVPVFVLLATGASDLLQRGASRGGVVTVALCAVVVVVLGARFLLLAPDVMRLPREANADSARAVRASEPPLLPVLAYMRNPGNLEHYLGRRPASLEAAQVAARVCGQRVSIAYVTQPFGIAPVGVPCLTRPGVQHERFEQYARGGETNVWLVPPR